MILTSPATENRIMVRRRESIFAMFAHSERLCAVCEHKHKDEIEVFYLPSYCPEYNPDEYLNGNLKRELADKGYSVNEDESESKARGIMKS